MSNQNSGKKGVIAGVVTVLVIAGGIFAYMRSSSNQNQVSTLPIDTGTPSTNPVGTTPSTTPVITNSKYKDGTYSAEGSYQSPGGKETIKVTLVLKNDIITDATVVSVVAERGESRQYQNRFISGYKQYVVGKNINDVNVTKVSGASLTPIGFMSALTTIKAQAQA